MRRIREITLEEVTEAQRVLMHAAGDTQRQLFNRGDSDRAMLIGRLSLTMQILVANLIAVATGLPFPEEIEGQPIEPAAALGAQLTGDQKWANDLE